MENKLIEYILSIQDFLDTTCNDHTKKMYLNKIGFSEILYNNRKTNIKNRKFYDINAYTILNAPYNYAYSDYSSEYALLKNNLDSYRINTLYISSDIIRYSDISHALNLADHWANCGNQIAEEDGRLICITKFIRR